MTFKFQKIKRRSETHETLFDVMSCQQDDVLQTKATHLKACGSEREQCMFDDEREITSPYGLQFFSTINVH